MALNNVYNNFNKNPLATLWTGRCIIYEFEDIFDSDTKQTIQQQVLVVENEPCRLSFKSGATTDIQSGVAMSTQNTVLFIRPDLIIKPGTVIEITQNGRTYKYKGSGVPAVYCNHQEISLELYENEI